MNQDLISPDQKQRLEQLAGESLQPHQRRARLLLLYDSGVPTREVSAQVALSRSRVRYWRQQFRLHGMDIFPSPENPEKKLEAELVVPVQATLPPEKKHGGLPLPQPLSCVGILPDDPMAEAGRKTMLFHFAEMLSHEAGTRLGQDPEQLHDMRVATRRLRAAFAVFERAFQPQALKPFLKRLRATGRALGHARDMDVILIKADRYLNDIPPDDHSGLQPLVQFWQDECTRARADMQVYLDSPKYSSFLRKFNRFVNTPGQGAVSIPQELPYPSRVRDVAPALIYTRLEAVRAYETILPNAAIAQLHALRIECKRFRYTVEFFREVLGEQVKSVINELKGLQDHLGDLHDADVACQIVRQFLIEWDPRQTALPLAERQNPQVIVNYLAYQSAELHRLMVSFPQAWDRFNRPEFRMNLAMAVAAL